MSKGKQRNTFKKPGELLLQRITCTCLQYVNSYVCVPAVHLDNFTPLICELVSACDSQQLFSLRYLCLEPQEAPSSIPVSLCLDVQTLAGGSLYNYSLAVDFLKPPPKEPLPRVYLSSVGPLDMLNMFLCNLFSTSFICLGSCLSPCLSLLLASVY